MLLPIHRFRITSVGKTIFWNDLKAPAWTSFISKFFPHDTVIPLSQMMILVLFNFNRRNNIFTFACNYLRDGMLYSECYTMIFKLLTCIFWNIESFTDIIMNIISIRVKEKSFPPPSIQKHTSQHQHSQKDILFIFC